MKAWIPIVLNLYRGGAALVLGIVLLLSPDKSSGSLANLMGLFWLSIGFVALRRDEEDERYPGKYTAWIAGVLAVVVGLLVVTRRFTLQWMAEDAIFFLLGTVILAFGLAHVFFEQRIGGITTNRVTGMHFLLGVFEILLGGLLILSPRLDLPLVRLAAIAWALIFAVFSITMAILTFMKNRRERTGAETAG